MEYNYYEDPDMGEWARECLDGLSPVFGSSHHRELTSALAHSTANLIALEAELERTRRTIVRQRAILAPIGRMPPEILSDIFHLALEDYTIKFFGEYWRQLVKITAVCRKWRAAALNTPRLWAWYQATWHSSAEYLAASQFWLARSGNVPLTVSLDEYTNDSILGHLSSAVLQRMVSIEIFPHGPPDWDTLFRFLGEAPQLRTLYIRSLDTASDQMGRLPFLRTLCFKYIRGIPRLECPSLVFLELIMVEYSSDDFKAIANAAPMLKSVLISECRRLYPEDGDENEGDILLPSLRTLELDTKEDKFYLDFIHSKNLQQLTVHLFPFNCHSIIPFPPLKHLLELDINLCLRREDIQHVVASVLSWLEQARQVKTLIIRIKLVNGPWNNNNFNELISCILARMVYCNLCPLLRAMTVPNCSLDSPGIIPEFKKQRYALHRLFSNPLEAYYVAHGWGT